MARTIASLLAFALAGCGTPHQPSTEIRFDDSGALSAGARASFGFGPRSGAPSEPQRGHAIEVSVSRASGEDSQTLSAGQPPVRHGGQGFAAPQQLAYAADLTYAEVAYRFRGLPENAAVGFEMLAGLARANLGLTISSPSQHGSEDVSTLGASLSFGVLWRLRPATTVQARATIFISTEEIEEARRLELSLVQALGGNFALRAGYLFADVDVDRGGALSKIRAKFSGPALGLDFMF